MADRDLAGIEDAIWRLLNGSSLQDTAAAAGIPSRELRAAADAYREAGHQALLQRAATGHRDWWQANIRFHHPTATDEVAATLLRPLIDTADTTWWFIRKYPGLRVRVQQTSGTDGLTLTARLAARLDKLAEDGAIDCWWQSVYEPEAMAFGGPDAMDHAHTLFTADSRAILRLVDAPVIVGRRELWALTCSTMMHAAGLEWYELGDAWHRVAQERPLPADTPADNLERLAADVGRFLHADTTPNGSLLATHAPLAQHAPWIGAFRELGELLGTAARTGRLQRGLRDVLSYHAIFHGNRLGLTARAQGLIAHAARNAVLGTPVRPEPLGTVLVPRPAAPSRRTPLSVQAAAVRRFPLVLQGRRPCPDLDTRIAEIRHCADACQDATADDLDRIDNACSVWNLAALVVADCGLHDLAAKLCVDQFRILCASWPVTGSVAIAALQPLVNLARLAGRSGDPAGAHRTLGDLDRAVRNGDTIKIGGLDVDFNDFTATEADRAEVTAWLRITQREDGTRALAATGDWSAAAEHAARYDDNPHLLRETRQARILAAASTHPDAALALIATSAMNEPWEHAVAACLCAHCTPAAPHAGMLAAVHDALTEHAAPVFAHFRFRLGLTALDLSDTLSPEGRHLCTRLVGESCEGNDAVLAREALAHPAVRATTNAHQRAALQRQIDRAGLGGEGVPGACREAMATAMRAAATALADILVLPAPHLP